MLQHAVPAESAAFMWLDESGGIVDFYSDEVPFPNFARFRSFRDWRFRGPFLAQSHDGSSVFSMPVGIRDKVIGRIVLMRSERFTKRDANQLTSISRYIAAGLARVEPLQERDYDPGPLAAEHDLLVAAANGDLLYSGDCGRRLLLLSTGQAFRPDVPHLAMRAAAHQLRDVCARVVVGRASTPPVEVLRDTLWGRILIRAYPIVTGPKAAAASVGIHIERRHPLRLRLAEAVQALGLSPRQRHVAFMIALGRTNSEIAQELRISGNTVAYHVKCLYGKFGVHDRRELRAKIGDRSPRSGTRPRGEETRC
ncbi:MAG TPA: helix-turn-helix transcriptional regulator [Usitatibacter sp.]|nr:helix-turn-helix transcriptional regulator [Usitatibacter sp.]